jgi:hypothetical protein
MIGARFASNVPWAQKLFWMHRMVLLGDEAQMESRFGLFGDIVSFSARLVHYLRQMFHSLRNRFGRTG